MRNICWPAWLSAIALVAFVLTTAGCQSAEPLVPREIYQQVNDDGREWTYDTAWQNIRKLNADLEARNLESIAEDSLVIVSQMERLKEGRATTAIDRRTRNLVVQVAAEVLSRSSEQNVRSAQVASKRLQDSFDAGDFESALEAAVEVYVVGRELATLGN